MDAPQRTVADVAVFRGAPPAPPRTLVDVLAHTVRSSPSAPALDDGTHTLTYAELATEARRRAGELRAHGVGRGDRVGIRLPSGSVDLYLAILGVLTAGAAYVPVDVDDPDERAELVWRESRACAVLGPDGVVTRGVARGGEGDPCPDDDAWVIFTSGSTGAPKGVAVSHRSAAAFVDAEAELFLPGDPVGAADRVLAGLSVAFDASCEEMWLAWRNGACLVPAPRALVRSGAELGPWLAARRITVVSTVPTLAALWSDETLEGVRLLVFGGEACPQDVVERFSRGGRAVWNTYGPTEATVVSCAARLRPGEPVRIGLPLDGWQLAVVDPSGRPVGHGEVGELVIAGVGLGRYLDERLDATRFAPLPELGWRRAYHSGDLVRAHEDGIEFVGRADDQVKVGGRRVELGEIEAALLHLPQVAAASVVVRRTSSGLDVLAGYVVPADGRPGAFDPAATTRALRDRLPAALVPRLVVLPELPTRSSGKVDKDALPWPPPQRGAPGAVAATDETTGWLLTEWSDVLGAEVRPDDDFFDLGGTSLAAARLVSRLRGRFPQLAVSDLYAHPRPVALSSRLRAADGGYAKPRERVVARTPRRAGIVQTLVQLLLFTWTGLRWLLVAGVAGAVYAAAGRDPLPWLPVASWWLLAAGAGVMLTSPGKVLALAGLVRLVRGRITPGTYRRGSATHLRLWTAERLVTAVGVASVPGTPLATWYARLLGCRVGRRVDLHSLPPVTGLGTFGDGAAVEPETDLAGWWLDGDELHVGGVHVGADARVGGRSTLLPGAHVGDRAQVLQGSSVAGDVPAGACFGGSPAAPAADTPRWPEPRGSRSVVWRCAFLLASGLRGLLVAASAVPAAVLAFALLGTSATATSAVVTLLLASPLLVLVGFCCHAVLLAGAVRLLSPALRPGTFPAASCSGCAAWLTHLLLDHARRALFPLYASLCTPPWLRLLGARVGRRVELSTALTLPKLLHVADTAFLADDVLAAPYELRGGWVRLGVSSIGRQSFVGNSGVVGPDHSVGDGALVGVLTDAPAHAPAGTSWLGRPAIRLRRAPEPHDPARTLTPPRRLVVARSAVELCRVLPLALSGMLGTCVVVALGLAWTAVSPWLALAVAGPALFAAGVVAGALTVLAKWLLMRRFEPGRHPLWSAFVWRNELYDTFVELLAVPWLVETSLGTPTLNWLLRGLGARIGRGVWCETHWLPEPDLVEVAEGATVNRGCVLQTHLFHDRVMRLRPVRLDGYATLGPRSIALPGSRIGAASTVTAGSLVMASEAIPCNSRWQGVPVTRTPELAA